MFIWWTEVKREQFSYFYAHIWVIWCEKHRCYVMYTSDFRMSQTSKENILFGIEKHCFVKLGLVYTYLFRFLQFISNKPLCLHKSGPNQFLEPTSSEKQGKLMALRIESFWLGTNSSPRQAYPDNKLKTRQPLSKTIAAP